MKIIHKLRMDLARCGCKPIVGAVQGEGNTRVLEISLFNNGIAWEAPTGATAAVAFTKPDGTKGLYDKLPDGSPATIISGSTVSATLAPQALTCAGTVIASIVFYDADLDTLATFPFKITVEANPAAGEQLSNNYYYLQNLEQVNAAYAELQKAYEAVGQQTAAAMEAAQASNGELTDIRTGYDGTKYPSAGDAVRSQIRGIKDELSSGLVIESKEDVAVYKSGSYVSEKGTIYAQGSFNIYEPIFIKAGYVIRFVATGYRDDRGNVVSVLSRTNPEEPYNPVVLSEDSESRRYECLIEEDGQYVITSAKDSKVIYTILYTQTAIESNIADIRERAESNFAAIDARVESLENYFSEKPLNVEYSFEGQYVYALGKVFAPHKSYCTTDIFQLKRGENLTFTSAVLDGEVVGVLSRWNENGSECYEIIATGTAEPQTVVYTAQDAVEYLRICKYNNANEPGYETSTPIIKVDVLQNIEKDLTLLSEEVEDHSERLKALEIQESNERELNVEYSLEHQYVYAPGKKLGTSNPYAATDVFPLARYETITFTSSVCDGEVVGVLSRWSEDGSECYEIIATGTREPQIVAYTATDEIEYLRISKCTSSGYITSIPVITSLSEEEHIQMLDKRFTQIEEVQDELLAELEECDLFSFIRVGVIGDSLASGASNYSGGAVDRPAYSWGKYIERAHGIPVTLFTKGGASTRSWLSSAWGLTAMQNADACDCYIIGLGVNDKYALGDNYLGTSADVTVGNESGNADTFYGNYSKIIAALLAKSPRCKVFCLTMPSRQGETALAFNVAIRDIVEMYSNAHLIDLETDGYFDGSEFVALWNAAHSTATGYKAIAEHLWKRMNKYIRENLSEFTDVQWILENYE